jgi:putative SOS response-associated peptidase YedK
MCGRVVQASGPLRLAIVDGLDVRDSRLTNVPRRYNGAPTQELLVIRQNYATGERSLDLLRWGGTLMPGTGAFCRWMKSAPGRHDGSR